MRNRRFLPVMLLPLFLAQAAPPAASPVSATTQRDAQSQECNVFLAPFIDDQTVFVAHLDGAAMDTGAMEAFITPIFDNMKLPEDDPARKDVPMVRTAANLFLARFKQLGGRHAFLVLNQADIYPAMSGPAIIFKVEPGGDAKGILALINATMGEDNGLVSVVRGDALILGAQLTQKRLESLKAAVRPDLKFSAGEEAAEGVLALTADQRRVLHDFLPKLPEEIGGGSIDLFTQDVFCISFKLRLPPKPGAWIMFHMKVGTSGAALSQGIVHVRDTILANKDFNESLDNDPAIKAMANDIRTLIKEVLTPNIMGIASPNMEFVTLAITDKQIEQMARLLAPALDRGRLSAERAQSAANIRQLVEVALIQAAEHNDMLPASMDELVKAAATDDQMKKDGMSLDPKALTNPDDRRHRPYIYRLWTAKLAAITNASATPIIWEDYDDSVDGRNVGFADGHVDFMRQDAFKKLIADTEAWAKTIKP